MTWIHRTTGHTFDDYHVRLARSLVRTLGIDEAISACHHNRWGDLLAVLSKMDHASHC